MFVLSHSVANEAGMVLCPQESDVGIAPRRGVKNDLSGEIHWPGDRWQRFLFSDLP